MDRREFLKVAGGVTGSCALGMQAVFGAEKAAQSNGMPRRVLGRTGERVSVVGFPGLALCHYEQDRCTAGLHAAFDRGLNYYDVAPAYGRNGECEIKMGVGLQGIDRDNFFLACKTKMRDKEGARKELERSLKRLKTDRFDLYQLHCLRTPEEVKKALGPGGAIETLVKAREEGKVKYLGFSAHTTKGALEAMRGFGFDTVMFPVSFVDYYEMGFGKAVLELAREQGAGVLAIKALSMGAWPQGAERKRKWWYRATETPEEVSLAMRFVLSLDGVVAGIPPSFLDLLDKAIDAAYAYQPISEAETRKVRQMAEGCKALFRREEESVAMGRRFDAPVYPDSPHECCPYANA